MYLSIYRSIYLDGPWSYVSSQDKIYYPAMFGDYQNLTAFTWYIIIHIYIIIYIYKYVYSISHVGPKWVWLNIDIT